MKLLISFTAHAVEVDGKFYNCGRALVDYKHLCRYRLYVDDLVVALRCKKADRTEDHWPRIDGDGITIAAIPDPATPFKSLLLLPKIIGAIIRAAGSCDRYYLKLPEPTSTLVGLVLWVLRKKYAAEVVADSKQGILFAKKDMPFVRVYAFIFDRLTRFLVKRAHCATYVSEYLRNRYPTRCKDRQWVFCSVELDEQSIGSPRPADSFKARPFKVISVGRMSPEKGHIYLIRGFKRLSELSKTSLELHLVGDGVERARLETEVRDLGIDNLVRFHGYVQRGPALFSLLDEAHLFVMPSLTEGMGRGLIEAMARGLPCIGSAVGGIPEYLDKKALFPPGDPEAIAETVSPLLTSPEQLAAMSRRNFEAAKAWRPEALQAVKRDFWREIIENCK